jgi:hypothetical protein
VGYDVGGGGGALGSQLHVSAVNKLLGISESMSF